MSRGAHNSLPVVGIALTALALLQRRRGQVAARPPRPPSGSDVCPSTGLSNDQAAAIAENAAAITARIDAKAARTRREARARAAAALLIVASVAYATASPAASAVALALCCAASAAFIADAARSSSARRAAHETVAKARAQTASVLASAPGPAASAPAAFEGKWVKDAAASDSMTPALDAVNLHGLVRRAVALMRGIELRTGSPPGTFQFSVFSALPWFRVTERYVLGGPPVRHRRRDLRRGGATGSARLAPPAKGGWAGEGQGGSGGGRPLARVWVDVAWGPPHAGSGRDTYELTGPDSLSVTTDMEVEGVPISYVARYKRKA